MSTRTLIATIATVVFSIASTALTATTAFAETRDDAVATSTSAAVPATVAGAALAATKTEKGSGLTREQVIAQTLEARKNGEIPETEADFDVAQTRKRAAK